MSALPERSHLKANVELVNAFDRYLESRGNSQATRRKYLDAVRRLAELIGPASLVDVERPTIRRLMGKWQRAGIASASIALLTSGLRSFYKWVNLAGLKPDRQEVKS